MKVIWAFYLFPLLISRKDVYMDFTFLTPNQFLCELSVHFCDGHYLLLSCQLISHIVTLNDIHHMLMT